MSNATIKRTCAWSIFSDWWLIWIHSNTRLFYPCGGKFCYQIRNSNIWIKIVTYVACFTLVLESISTLLVYNLKIHYHCVVLCCVVWRWCAWNHGVWKLYLIEIRCAIDVTNQRKIIHHKILQKICCLSIMALLIYYTAWQITENLHYFYVHK